MNEPTKGVEVPPLNPVLSNRAAFLEQIADRSEQDNAPGGISEAERNEYLSQVKSTYGQGPDTELAEQDADEQPPSSPAPSQNEDAAADSSALDTVTLMVRGKTIIKPRTEVDEHGGVAMYQRELAADDYLQEARSILEEAKKYPRLPPEPAPEETQSEDDVVALTRAIRMGTDDEAADAVRRLKSTAFDPNKIDSMIRNSIESREDLSWFLSEYKDVQSDTRLFNALREEDEQKWKSGDHRPRRERWKELGDAYRKYVKPANPMQDKRERKSSIVSIPSASVRQPAAQIDEGPEDPRDVIAQMRKQRGQA